ncbi:hypothetical protein HWV62_14824 [Athelia sp. TMB]|nr:hypothetical protein HWV62_14824 [Athelia sp. TMB]
MHHELGASSTDVAERDNSSLANLALVCRDWLEPALDGLWKMQGQLLPLLRTLPTIIDILVAVDWLRFNYYARRMRHLCIRPEDMHHDVFLILDLCFQGRPLFSHLTSLDWGSHGSTQAISLSTILPFLQTSLRRLSIIFPISLSSPGAAVHLLSALEQRTPWLKRLDIRGSRHVAYAALKAAPSLPNLDVFLIKDFVLPNTPRHQLAHFKSLRSLSITLDKDIHFAEQTPHHFPGFPSLETVDINTAVPSYATMFILGFLAGLPLREFTLEFTNGFNQEDVTHLTSAMTQSFRHDSIAAIKIGCSESAGLSPRDHTIVLDANMLRKLFVFRCMEVFHFNARMIYRAVDNNFIEDLTTHWCALRELSLVPAGRTPCSATGVDLDGLLHFANCRHLTNLSILFDGRNCNRWPQRPPAKGLSCSSLRHLHVPTSLIDLQALDIVAGLLSDLFPNLQGDIKFMEPSIAEQTSVGHVALWTSVTVLYNLFVKIRRQERLALAPLAPS